MNYIERISDFDFQISAELDDKIAVSNFSFQRAQSGPSNSLPDSVIEFYQQVNNLTYEWETKELTNEDGQKLRGRIKILKAEQVIRDWNDIVLSEDEDDGGSLKNFKVVDFFVDEACAGFLLTESKEVLMRYLHFGDDEAASMGIDFNGYLELMFAARGFWYWQVVVLNIKNGSGHEVEVQQFKTYMPQIFPDFKWEDFVALYESVRIK